MPIQPANECLHRLQVEDASTTTIPNLQSSVSSKIDNVGHIIVIFNFHCKARKIGKSYIVVE